MSSSTSTAAGPVVAGSPALLADAAASLDDASARLDGHVAALGAAASQFRATRPDFGGFAAALSDDIAARLVHEGGAAARLGTAIAELADALEAVDRAGLGGPLGQLGPLPGVVVVGAALLDTFRVGLDSSIGEYRQALRRRWELLVAGHDGTRWAGFPVPADALAAQIEALGRLLAQLDAVVDGRVPGWAGAGDERWITAGAFLAAAALGEAAAGEIERNDVDEADGAFAGAAFASRHPFLAAALSNDIVITPARLAILLELDRLAGLPIDDFLEEREVGLRGSPLLDWSSDECSGPVISSADHHCYRHDFIYRNARMVRDQWGLPQGFADDLKDVADERLTVDVLGDTPRWPLRPELFIWGGGVGLAVSWFGSVDEPWTPPNR